MAGGPWQLADVGQGRPGLFINFVTTAIAAINPLAKGTVGIPVKAAWGPDNVVQAIYTQADLRNYYGISQTAPYNSLYAGSQAFNGGATRLNMYRMESAGTPGTKATHNFADTQGVPATAFSLTGKYNGARGNNFAVVVQANAVDNTKTDVILYESGLLVDTWTNGSVNRGVAGHIADIVATINADPNNFFVTAALVGADSGGAVSTPASVALPGAALAGGGDGGVLTAADYSAALSALEAYQMDTFTVDVTDTDITGIRATIDSWVQNMRNYGKRVFWMTGSDIGESAATAQTNAKARNAEYCAYVWPGVKQTNNAGILTTYRGAAFAAQMAGMKAALGYGQGFTNRPLVSVVDLETRPLNQTIISNEAAGVLTLYIGDDQIARMDKGITTLTTIGTNTDGTLKKPKSFMKISVVNTVDNLANSLTVSGNQNYVGQVINDDVGQKALMTVTRDFLQWFAGQRGIKGGYTVALDTNNVSAGDQVFLVVGVTPNDTMDYIYFTVIIGA